MSEFVGQETSVKKEGQIVLNKATVAQFETDQEAFKHAIEDLDIKLQKSKAEVATLIYEKNLVVKAKEISDVKLDDQNLEISKLKNSSKSLKAEIEALKKETNSLSNAVKIKEKEINKIKVKNENNSENLLKVKNENSKLKIEKNKAVKDRMEFEKKIKTPPQTSSKSTDMSPSSCHSTSTNTSCSYSNMSTNTNTCSYSNASTNTTTPDSNQNTPATSIFSKSAAASSTSTPSTSSHICSHSTQCIERQPKPPPQEKCSILQHTGSKYHEHMASMGGVPARYHTHENCMEIDHHNYGCRDCVWYKWWGELHGYPDVNPWDFKKYLDPSEWPALGLW